jgi:hypothetical protein
MSSCATRSWAFLVALAMGAALLSYLEARRASIPGARRAKGWQESILRYNHAPWG